MELYRALTARDFVPEEAIDLTAVVELDVDGTRSLYFIWPRNGGMEIECQRKEITEITPHHRKCWPQIPLRHTRFHQPIEIFEFKIYDPLKV
jgi:hypothetical protein